MTQASYDLARLARNGLITRRPIGVIDVRDNLQVAG
jgi:hypothetical protein